MNITIPMGWLMTVGACMVAILGIQLADTAGIPKWAQWAIAAGCIIIAWASTR